MQKKYIYAFVALAFLIAIPVSIYAIQSVGKRNDPGLTRPGAVPGAQQDPPLTRLEAERRRRFVGQFGEAHADLAMSEADRVFEGIFDRLNGPITVQGTVRSSDGSPLPEVLVEAGVSISSMSWNPTGGVDQEVRTDGPFEFRTDEASEILLSVSARGFYPVYYRVDRQFDTEGFDKLFELGADVSWESERLVVRDIDIVLTPRSTIPELQEFRGGGTHIGGQWADLWALSRSDRAYIPYRLGDPRVAHRAAYDRCDDP